MCTARTLLFGQQIIVSLAGSARENSLLSVQVLVAFIQEIKLNAQCGGACRRV